MKVPSNLLSDLYRFYTRELVGLYGDREAGRLMEILLRHLFGADRLQMALHPERRINESELLLLHAAVKRLKKAEPIQYITGEASFDGHTFLVSPAVLIPRQETEQLIQLCSANLALFQSGTVVDVGAGSGCIAISLALRHPHLESYATDISEGALAVAQLNASRLNARVHFIRHDVFHSDIPVGREKCRLVVSNPPYVTFSEKSKMHPNVLDFEPHLALFVQDEQALIFYQQITQSAKRLLSDGGMLAFEINERFGAETAALLKSEGFVEVQTLQDYHEKDRFVCGFWHC